MPVFLETVLLLRILFPDDKVFGEGPNIVPVQLSIPVLDVNDNKPEFIGTPYSFSVVESTTKGATLFSDIVIKDLDSGEHARVKLTCLENQVNLQYFVWTYFFKIVLKDSYSKTAKLFNYQ